MSALLMAALLLAAAVAFFEIRLMRKVPFLQKLTQRFGVFGILFSMFLAVLLGTIFGAAGLTAMIAGVVGTALTQPYHSWQHRKANMPEEQRSKMGLAIEDYKATYRPVFKTIKIVLIILTSPIWVPVKIRNWYVKHRPATARQEHAAAA